MTTEVYMIESNGNRGMEKAKGGTHHSPHLPLAGQRKMIWSPLSGTRKQEKE